jgi:hypothetical protein
MMPGMTATPSLSRRVVSALAVAVPVLLCMGNSCVNDVLGTTPTTTTNDAGTVVNITGPQLEVTVDGVHVGPDALVTGAYADYEDVAGAVGESSASTVTIHAVTSESSFDFAISVFGTGVVPIHATSYALETALDTGTDNGAASLADTPTLTAGGLTLECDDGSCGGGVVTITALDTAHVAGYLSATMANPQNGQESMVVVSFYVPWQTYNP